MDLRCASNASHPPIISPLGKAISGDEVRRTREQLIDRLQWCATDEREHNRQLAKRTLIALTLPVRFLEFSGKGFEPAATIAARPATVLVAEVRLNSR